MRHDGYQCGYCTPGQICSATAMLDEVRDGWPSAASVDLEAAPELSDEEIGERMSGNLCRCACYPNIVDGDPGRGRGAGPMRPFDYVRAPPTAVRRRPPPLRAQPSSPAAPTCST